MKKKLLISALITAYSLSMIGCGTKEPDINTEVNNDDVVIEHQDTKNNEDSEKAVELTEGHHDDAFYDKLHGFVKQVDRTKEADFDTNEFLSLFADIASDRQNNLKYNGVVCSSAIASKTLFGESENAYNFSGICNGLGFDGRIAFKTIGNCNDREDIEANKFTSTLIDNIEDNSNEDSAREFYTNHPEMDSLIDDTYYYLSAANNVNIEGNEITKTTNGAGRDSVSLFAQHEKYILSDELKKRWEDILQEKIAYCTVTYGITANDTMSGNVKAKHIRACSIELSIFTYPSDMEIDIDNAVISNDEEINTFDFNALTSCSTIQYICTYNEFNQ